MWCSDEARVVAISGLLFLLELILLVVTFVLFAKLGVVGAATDDRTGQLALGLYALALGVGISLVPQILWPVARTDNAFLGHFMFSAFLLPLGLLLVIAAATSLRRSRYFGLTLGFALLLAAVGAALSLGFLIFRGPEPWQTRPTGTFGSGTFGFDIVLASLTLSVLVFVAGRYGRQLVERR